MSKTQRDRCKFNRGGRPTQVAYMGLDGGDFNWVFATFECRGDSTGLKTVLFLGAHARGVHMVNIIHTYSSLSHCNTN